MSKKGKGGGNFDNEAARRFKDPNRVALMTKPTIDRILDNDIEKILDQVTAHRKKPSDGRCQYPQYMANAFASLETSIWFKKYVYKHVKVKKDVLRTDLTEDQVESLKEILSDAYKKSFSNFYANQLQEYTQRNRFISLAFARLSPDLYYLTGKLKTLDEVSRRDLTIQLYGDPVRNFKFIHRKFNESTVSDKKKLKILKRAYGKRFIAAVGAAMTVEGNNSDCLAMLFDFICSKKKKKRGPYLRAYALAYMKNTPSRYFRFDNAFYQENKRVIKALGGSKKHPERALDPAFWKAFKDMRDAKSESKKDKGGPRRDRTDNRK